jgi:hypothetical protein
VKSSKPSEAEGGFFSSMVPSFLKSKQDPVEEQKIEPEVQNDAENYQEHHSFP